MMKSIPIFLFFLLIVVSTIEFTIARIIETDDYIIWTIPDAAEDKIVNDTQSGLAMIGGGADCYPAFAWLIDHANGGDFVVLRVGGTDAYNQFVYDLSVTLNKTLNSVTTISWKNQQASYAEEVLTLLRNAELIFFSGGDQSLYVKYWANTEVQTIIQQKLESNVSVGGTSAGLAIQGDYIYSAVNGSVFSDDCLTEPYNKFVTFADAFIKVPFLENVITDTHFSARDRMGRMLTFLARITKGDAVNGKKTPETINPKEMRAVGVDEQTALLLDIYTGKATTVGANNAFICNPSHQAEVLQEDQPLTFTDISCMRLSSKTHDVYDFLAFDGDGVLYTNSIVNGEYTTTPYGPEK